MQKVFDVRLGIDGHWKVFEGSMALSTHPTVQAALDGAKELSRTHRAEFVWYDDGIEKARVSFAPEGLRPTRSEFGPIQAGIHHALAGLAGIGWHLPLPVPSDQPRRKLNPSNRGAV